MFKLDDKAQEFLSIQSLISLLGKKRLHTVKVLNKKSTSKGILDFCFGSAIRKDSKKVSIKVEEDFLLFTRKTEDLIRFMLVRVL
jgi:hypothetical protein